MSVAVVAVLGVLCVYLAIRLHCAKAAGYEQYCYARRHRAELLQAEMKVWELEQHVETLETLGRDYGV